MSFLLCMFSDLTYLHSTLLLKFERERKPLDNGRVSDSDRAHSLYDFAFRFLEHLLRGESGRIAPQHDHCFIILSAL